MIGECSISLLLPGENFFCSVFFFYVIIVIWAYADRVDSVAECEDIENNKAYIIPAALSISNPGITSTTVGDALVLTLTCDITTLGPFVNDTLWFAP